MFVNDVKKKNILYCMIYNLCEKEKIKRVMERVREMEREREKVVNDPCK